MLSFPELTIRISDDTYYFQWDRRKESPQAKFFCFTKREFYDVVNGRISEVRDIGHRLSIQGDVWTIYDVEFPHAPFGEIHGRYWHCEMPRKAAKILLRYLKWLDTKRTKNDYIEATIPLATRQRWLNRYGQGKGSVEVVTDPACQERLERDMRYEEAVLEGAATSVRERRRSLREQYDGLLSIARNSTASWRERAFLSISTDLDGYYWVAKTPAGQRILNGALVNHSKSAEPDWSTHT
jgi:hypothetical protein